MSFFFMEIFNPFLTPFRCFLVLGLHVITEKKCSTRTYTMSMAHDVPEYVSFHDKDCPSPMIQDGKNHWHQQLRGILQTWSI